ncbi:TIGR03545 family protein [Zhongshania aquimaris]|uniref:TIGR03545 family protein n=1 Tax=Zhongshania aquimaris TaxID=2857107 RepID=A0ABS6VU41_9GAMM|nr:TIGR03545 family protein [Zhongshania aquimaris]MBW2941260.1 TIGR03545 family protein [Zhongshania aquimaris]
MFKRILQGIVILLVVAVIGVVFALEPIAKFVIESEGSKQVGARVDVDSVDISFYPTHVALNGLTVANPQEPMRNLLQSEKVSADVDAKALLKMQVIADQVVLSGLQMYTERSTPGTLDGSMPPPKEDSASGMPSISLPDPNALLAEEKANIQAEVTEIQTGFTDIESRWKTKSEKVPDQTQFDQYKKRWDELKNKNVIERLAGAKELRDDIKAELRQFDNLKEDLKADSAAVKSLSLRAANLPADQSKRMMSKYGLDQGTEGMLRFLLGDEVNATVQRGLTLYKETMGKMASAEEPAPSTEPAADLPVNILIRKILIDGYQVIGGEKLAYSGEINDVTDKQDYWNKPITMALRGGMEQKSQLVIDGIFDQRNDTLKSVFNMGLKQLALSGVSLSQSPELPLQLEKGIADIAANFSIDGDNLKGSVAGLVNQAKLLVAKTASDNKTANLLAAALEDVSKLVMDLSVNGTVNDPAIKLKSNLDRILGDVLGAELKSQLADAQTKLKSKLSEDYGPQMAQLQDKQNMLSQYQDLLGDREAALQALMKEMM